MQTHKNPNLRAQGSAAPSKSLSGPKPYKAPTTTSKVTAPGAKKEAPKKTPKTELEGKKWIVVSARNLNGEIKFVCFCFTPVLAILAFMYGGQMIEFNWFGLFLNYKMCSVRSAELEKKSLRGDITFHDSRMGKEVKCSCV